MWENLQGLFLNAHSPLLVCGWLSAGSYASAAGGAVWL